MDDDSAVPPPPPPPSPPRSEDPASFAPAGSSEAAAPSVQTLEIEARDVVRLIEQFMRESGLTKSLAALVDETGVGLPFIDGTGEAGRGDEMLNLITSGKWDMVLPQLSATALPAGVFGAIYSQVVLELVEARDIEAARAVLTAALPLQVLRTEDAAAFARLERAVNSSSVLSQQQLYSAGNKETARQELARLVSEQLVVVQPSRLMVLLSQALKWQQHTGMLPPGVTQFDIFSGSTRLARDLEDSIVKVSAGTIRFGSAYPLCAAFSSDGRSLVTGSGDGILEVFDADTCRIRNDLAYQRDDEFMIHDTGVLAAVVSSDGELLASGSRDGQIKIWRLSTGDCVRKFQKAHVDGVTCLAFSPDLSHLLSGGFDGVARIHGLRSGKILKEFRGHSGALSSLSYLHDATSVVTASMDGSVKVWDGKTQACLHTLTPPQAVAGVECPIVAVLVIPRSADHLLIVPRAGTAYIMTTKGSVLRTLSHGKELPPEVATAGGGRAASERASRVSPYDFIAATVSPQGKLELAVEGVGTKDILGVAHHPSRNLLATYSADGALRLWKP